MVKRSSNAIGLAFWLLSAAVWLGVMACFLLRPDACAAVTVWPAWVYAMPGVLLLLPPLRCQPRRGARILALLWVLFIALVCEEPRSVTYGTIRSHFVSAPKARLLRVVSLNCQAGSSAAAEEVIAYHPDIVLLQESPDRAEVQALARKLFGKNAGCVWGVDCSVLFRGRRTQSPVKQQSSLDYTQAHVRTRTGVDINCFSIRLSPPAFRVDVWSRSNWGQQANLRMLHRRQLRAVAREIEKLPSREAVIVGGDFNCPQGDGATRELTPRLRDCFCEGGAGWGNTVLNEVPVLRYDQIWASRQLRVLSVKTYRTKHSDHRLVVCDLAVPAGERK